MHQFSPHTEDNCIGTTLSRILFRFHKGLGAHTGARGAQTDVIMGLTPPSPAAHFNYRADTKIACKFSDQSTQYMYV